jgi:hypothetical protein
MADAERKRRFVQEAAAAALRHPNIASIYEAGSAGDWVAMELVGGRPAAVKCEDVAKYGARPLMRWLLRTPRILSMGI